MDLPGIWMVSPTFFEAIGEVLCQGTDISDLYDDLFTIVSYDPSASTLCVHRVDGFMDNNYVLRYGITPQNISFPSFSGSFPSFPASS